MNFVYGLSALFLLTLFATGIACGYINPPQLPDMQAQLNQYLNYTEGDELIITVKDNTTGKNFTSVLVPRNDTE